MIVGVGSGGLKLRLRDLKFRDVACVSKTALRNVVQVVGKFHNLIVLGNGGASMREREICFADAAAYLLSIAKNVRLRYSNFLARDVDATAALWPNFQRLIDQNIFVRGIARGSRA